VLLAAETQRLFTIGIPITEKIVRVVVVYAAVLLLLRMGGKRTAAQLNSFDLVVLLLISNVVQNSIIGPDNSLLGGLIGATALVIANDLITRFVRRSNAVDRVIQGTESTLVEDGAFLDRELRRLGIRTADLEVALRRQGAEHVSQVERPVCIHRVQSLWNCGPRPMALRSPTSIDSSERSISSPRAWIA